MILLDTHAIVWLHQGKRRAQPLARQRNLHVSPASVLELQFLLELSKIRLRGKASVADLVRDERWTVDDVPAAAWFERAAGVGWTRDPFDRLLVGHAQIRGWRLATADTELLDHLGIAASLEL